MSALLPPRSCGLSLSLSRMRQRKGDVFQIRCGEESDVVLFAPRARGRRRPSVLKTRNCISASGQPRVSKDGDNVHVMEACISSEEDWIKRLKIVAASFVSSACTCNRPLARRRGPSASLYQSFWLVLQSILRMGGTLTIWGLRRGGETEASDAKSRPRAPFALTALSFLSCSS
jgi:hypothetical protein